MSDILTKKLSPEEIAEMSEDHQCSCKELEQLRDQLRVACIQRDNAADEIERLQKREKDLMDVIDSRDRALGFVPLDDALHPGPSISKAFANSPRRVSHEPLPCVSFPTDWEKARDVVHGIVRQTSGDMRIGALHCLHAISDAMRGTPASPEGASRDASSPCPSVHDHMWAEDGHCMRCYAQKSGR